MNRPMPTVLPSGISTRTGRAFAALCVWIGALGGLVVASCALAAAWAALSMIDFNALVRPAVSHEGRARHGPTSLALFPPLYFAGHFGLFGMRRLLKWLCLESCWWSNWPIIASLPPLVLMLNSTVHPFATVIVTVALFYAFCILAIGIAFGYAASTDRFCGPAHGIDAWASSQTFLVLSGMWASFLALLTAAGGYAELTTVQDANASSDVVFSGVLQILIAVIVVPAWLMAAARLIQFKADGPTYYALAIGIYLSLELMLGIVEGTLAATGLTPGSTSAEDSPSVIALGTAILLLSLFLAAVMLWRWERLACRRK